MDPKHFRPGYVRDLPHLRTQRPAVTHPFIKARLAALPAAVSLEAYEAPIFDQGRSGACGGHGSAQLIATATNAARVSLPFVPSPRRAYLYTRAVRRAADAAGAETLPALTDSGVMPADLATAFSRYGVTAQAPLQTPDGRNSDVWTPDDIAGIANAPPANVNDEIAVEDLEASAFTVITGEYRIDETQSTKVVALQMAASIAAFIPVGVGGFVDSAVMGFTAGSPPLDSVNLSDPNGGGHWFAVTSYRLDEATGLYVFRVANSWGAAYGDKGHFEVTENWITQAASDIYPWAITRISSHRNAVAYAETEVPS